MPAVFLDYATVSFDGDLDPRSLHAALPGLEIRDHTAPHEIAARVAGREVVFATTAPPRSCSTSSVYCCC
jgi:hypothetical protein